MTAGRCRGTAVPARPAYAARPRDSVTGSASTAMTVAAGRRASSRAESEPGPQPRSRTSGSGRPVPASTASISAVNLSSRSGEVHLLLAVPAGDPVTRGGGVEFRQFRHAMLLVTGYACFVSYNPRRMASNWSSELQQSHGYGCPDGGRAGEPADAGRGPQPGVRPPAGAERAARLNALFTSAGSRTEVTDAEAEAFVPVAADLRVVFAAVAAGDVDDAAHRVNDMLAATGAHPALERHDGEPWHIHFHSADETSRVQGLGGRLRHRAGHRPRRRTVRPARRVHRAALRPGLRRHLTQRKQAVLLHRLPEPGQGRRLPRTPRLGPSPGSRPAPAPRLTAIARAEEADFVPAYCLRFFSSVCAASARRLIALSRLSHWAASSAMALVAWSRRSASTW